MTEPTLQRLLQQARYDLDRTTDVHTGPIDPLQFNTLRRAFDRMLRYLEAQRAARTGPAQAPGEPRCKICGEQRDHWRHAVLRQPVSHEHHDFAAVVVVAEPADDLTELQRLCDAATPGPWALDSEELFVLDSVGAMFTLETGDDGSEALGASLAAARFAIAARDALPKLIAEVRRLQGVLGSPCCEKCATNANDFKCGICGVEVG